MGSCCVAQRAQLGVLYDLEGSDEGDDGREVQEGGDICLHIHNSCIAETNTSYTTIEKRKHTSM